MKKNYYSLTLIPLFLLLITGLVACSNSPEADSTSHLPQEVSEEVGNTVKMISAEELMELIGKDLFLLDIRYANDFLESHLEGSVNIPFSEVVERYDELPFDQEIAIICYGGSTSLEIAEKLRDAGFQPVVVDGGYKGIEAVSK